MLRILFTNQRRSFHQSAIHWNYTRTALRRLKKPELVALAGRHKLDTSGTKNDIIDRLLTSSTESNYPSTTDITESPSSTRSEKSTPVQPINTTAMTGANPSKPGLEMSNTETLSSSSTTTPPSSSTPTATILTDNINDGDEEYDQQWVEAFDLKVGNRRSGLNELGGRERSASSSLFSKRHPHSASPTSTSTTTTTTSASGAASSSTHPAYVHQTVGVDPATNPNFISLSSHRPTVEDEPLEFTDPEINQHWVKVFDQRVKTRTKIMGLDTLDVNPKMTPSSSTNQQHRQLLDDLPSPASNTTLGNESTSNPSSTGNIKAIDTVIGTSLVTWYILGSEGIQSALSSLFS